MMSFEGVFNQGLGVVGIEKLIFAKADLIQYSLVIALRSGESIFLIRAFHENGTFGRAFDVFQSSFK